MNERIRELADQAGITTNLDTDYFEKDLGKWIDYYSEKFAELIVRECVDWCNVHATVDGTAQKIAASIKKDFGVES